MGSQVSRGTFSYGGPGGRVAFRRVVPFRTEEAHGYRFTALTNHMGFPDDVEMRDRLRAIGCVDEKTQLVITHFSHNGKLLHEELEALAAPEGFRVAYDGAIFEI